MKIVIFFKILFIVGVFGAQQRVDPLVLINQGLVRGQKTANGSYSTFLGIPYAKVDLYKPFDAAGEAPNFEEEIFYATNDSTICPQAFDGFGQKIKSIDCLKLNIYVPSQASSRNPLPVLVWVHGGGFMGGSAEGISNVVKHGIVFVTINYRLGPYGFMCLDDPAVPGNQGLKDQYAALQWVRQNIAAFGGNPYNVTLGGFSAGSASVLLQLYSSKTKLFNKIIAESGTHFSPDMFFDGDSGAAVKLANYLGLNTTDNEQALKFLAKTDHTLVTGAVTDLGLDFKPCREKYFDGVESFITQDHSELSIDRKIRNTPVLIGNTDLEYVGDIKFMHGEDYFESDFFISRIRQIFNLDDVQLREVAEIVRHFYIGDKPISEDINTEAEQFNSDFVFNHPIQDTITSLIRQNAGPIYEYVFSYVGKSDAAGAGHSAEMEYLFENDQLRKRSACDQLMADRMTTLWVNFIKYGNPTPKTSDLIPLTWTPASGNQRPYLNIDSDLRMEQRFLSQRMAFWDFLYLSYGQQ